MHDDENIFVKRYAEKLEQVDNISDHFEIVPLKAPEFRVEMKKLTKRRLSMRGSQNEYPNQSKLDTAAIFIVDWDLLRSDTNAQWNSEIVAYLTRCFSNCGLLIGMNLPSCHEFDLTLRGNLDSYADLNILSKQLTNQGLWGGSRNGFSPWYWPNLLQYLDSFGRRIQDVKEHFEEPISEVIGIPDFVQLVPKSVSEFIGGEDPTKTTFKDFVEDSSNGLRLKDKNTNVETLCRIAAARVSKWLERRLLPGQNAVVDAPHLVSRFPSLLREDIGRKETLDRTANLGDYQKLGIRTSKIERFRVKSTHWYSRPIWFWRKMAEYEEIEEVATPWEKKHLRYRFCEDASQFHISRICKEFDSAVDSPYIRRYVRYFQGVDYQPRVRLLVQQSHEIGV